MSLSRPLIGQTYKSSGHESTILARRLLATGIRNTLSP